MSSQPPRPKYEQSDDDKPALAPISGQPESPNLGPDYIPGKVNGSPAPTVPLRFRGKAGLSRSNVRATLGGN